jgi:hypothetical protein
MSYIYDVNLRLEGQWGAVPATRINEAFDYALSLPFDFTIARPQISNCKVAVFAHIFYPELTDEIRQALENIPVPYSVYVSTNTEEKAALIRKGFAGFPKHRLDVRVFENRGRDIAPFLVGFDREIRKHDHILHIHSKISPHDGDLVGWREYTFQHLLGSRDIVSSILYGLQKGDVDCLYPDHFGPVRQSMNFGYDFDLMKALLGRLNVPFSKDIPLEFPSGSMFWANSKALLPLLDLGLKFSDFPDELGQIDGTLAHAIERSLLYIVESTGGRYAKLGLEESTKPTRLIKARAPEQVRPAISRVYRRLLGNRLSVGHRVNYMDEICNVQLRPEPSVRPRLTLLLPTLNPEKVFGGISSAIRLFREMSEKLGSDVDYRIISLNEPVDMAAMTTVPDYTLLSLGAENTEIPFSVMDASGLKDGELPVRRNEVFMATAWWTAVLGFRMKDMQKSHFKTDNPIVYLIQDHEPDFYGWSSKFMMARSTYMRRDDTIAVINSEELAEFCARQYTFKEVFCMTYKVNAPLRNSFTPLEKEKLILVYGRPTVSRNAFELLMDGLCIWQQNNPMQAKDWKIISLGETYSPARASHVSNLSVQGKVQLKEYADILCRASVGVSLMVSPHPSYPPLEMAEAGVFTITNTYDGKDLTKRSPNIYNVDILTPEQIAAAIEAGVRHSETTVGKPAKFQPIADLSTTQPLYTADKLAASIKACLQPR